MVNASMDARRPGEVTAVAVQVRLLGPVEVTVSGRPVHLSGQLRVVLLVLAMSAGGAVSPDRIATALWGQELPEHPRASVQTYITRLRRALGAACIGTRGSGYVLTADVDALTFLALLDQAADGAAERELLERALRLWRDTPFEGVRSAWLEQTEAPRLTERYLSAVERRIDLDVADGRLDGLVARLRELTSRHPLRESLWVRLLTVLERSGRQAEALEGYETIRRRIADELGADPGPQLRALHARLLEGRAPVRAEPAFMAAVVPRQLPADVPGFTGRGHALTTMDNLVGDGLSPLVIAAICGAAGIGKTALALHWAHQVADRFPDGQLYVNLRGFDPSGSPRPPAEVMRGFLDALQVPPQRIPSDVDAQGALYRSLLSGRRMLVMLDNARDADQVRPLLPGAQGCMVVVTSRDRLLSLVAAEGAHSIQLGLLTPEESRQLLAQRLGQERLSAEPEAAGDIIEASARLPLALAIVAARAAADPAVPLAALTAELRRGLDALDIASAVTDVRSVFSWSYRMLSSDAARLFRLLGLHPGPDLTATAAASVAGLAAPKARRLLAELAGAHLLIEHVPGRYSLHDLLRAYAGEQALASESEPDRDEARRRMLDHYTHTACAAAVALYPQRDPITLPAPRAGVSLEPPVGHRLALPWFVAEHQVLRALLTEAVVAGSSAHTWQLAWSMVDFLDRRGHWHEIVWSQSLAIEAARRLGDVAATAQAHRDIARAHCESGAFADAHRHLRDALELYRQQASRIHLAHTHRNIGWVYESQGDQSKAIEYSGVALELYRAVGDRLGQARSLNAMGWNYCLLGQYRRALRHSQRALALHQALGNLFGQATTWDSIGHAHHHLGRLDEAMACYQRTLGLYREVGSRLGEAQTFDHMGDVHRAAGDFAAAHRAWQRALEIYDELGHADAGQVSAKLREAESDLKVN